MLPLPVLALPTGLPLPSPDRIFTTLRVRDGVLCSVDAHLARLSASTVQLWQQHLPISVTAALREPSWSVGLTGRVRVTVELTPSGLLSYLQFTPVPQTLPKLPPLQLVPVSGRTGDWRHKWSDRRQIEAARQLLKSGASPLFVEAGQCLETDIANVFVADGEQPSAAQPKPGQPKTRQLSTPPLSANVLPGVARARVIEVARSLGWRVVERELALQDLGAPMFVTNSIVAARPVARVGKRKLCPPDAELQALLDELSAAALRG